MQQNNESVTATLLAFGLSMSEFGQIARQTAEIFATMKRHRFETVRQELNFRNALLSAYQNRSKNEETLAARLAEIDTTLAGRHGRAACYIIRLHKLQDGAFWKPASRYMHLYRPYEKPAAPWKQAALYMETPGRIARRLPEEDRALGAYNL